MMLTDEQRQTAMDAIIEDVRKKDWIEAESKLDLVYPHMVGRQGFLKLVQRYIEHRDAIMATELLEILAL